MSNVYWCNKPMNQTSNQFLCIETLNFESNFSDFGSNFFLFEQLFSNFEAYLEQLFCFFGATFPQFISTICLGLVPPPHSHTHCRWLVAPLPRGPPECSPRKKNKYIIPERQFWFGGVGNLWQNVSILKKNGGGGRVVHAHSLGSPLDIYNWPGGQKFWTAQQTIAITVWP